MKKGILNILLWSIFNYFKFVISSDKLNEHDQVIPLKMKLENINSFNSINHDDDDDENEKEQLEGFLGILGFIDLICEETLKRPAQQQKEFIVTWLSAINTLAEEIHDQQTLEEIVPEKQVIPTKTEYKVTSIKEEASYFDFDVATLKPDSFKRREDEFAETLKYSKSNRFISAAPILYPFNDWKEDFQSHDQFDHYQFLIKSKMLKYDDEDEKENDLVVDKGRLKYSVLASQLQPRELITQQSEDEDDEDNFQFCREEVVSNMRLENEPTLGDELELEGEGGGTETDELQLNDHSVYPTDSATFTTKMNAEQMEQLQQQILLQIVNRIDQNHPQLSSIIQTERENIQAAMVGDSDIDTLPKMDQASVLRYLRTSALPKLINSAIKGKTGIDVLKSLSLASKVVNETLGIVEVILKIILKIIRKIRYFSLAAAEIFADMAREDNAMPFIDLSVSLDSVREIKKSRLSGLTKMFRKGLKTAYESENGLEIKEDPFTSSIQAALSTARDYSSNFKKLPDTLLLSLIHTIFTELEKKSGVIRSALAQKKHKTFAKRQQSVNEAVDLIYRAIIKSDGNAADHLSEVPSAIFTHILFSLISSIDLDPVNLEVHITKVTNWIKPMMMILDQESQLSVLNYFLTDPEAESSVSGNESANTKSSNKSNSNAQGSKLKSSAFRWSLSKKKL